MALVWGAIGVFKNPASHPQVEFDDPTFAADVILLADLLLRILDRTEKRSTAAKHLNAFIAESVRRSDAAVKGWETRRRRQSSN
jgi:hypothetical protein